MKAKEKRAGKKKGQNRQKTKKGRKKRQSGKKNVVWYYRVGEGGGRSIYGRRTKWNL